MAESKRLGKGLGAIFGDDVSSVLEDIQQGNRDDLGGVKTVLKVKDIKVNPYQPRRHFDDDKLKELADSIETHGLFQPVLVRETSNGFELVAGERRLRASKLANLIEIPAIVVEFDDEQMMEIAVIENIQREDLNVIEEAGGYKLLMDRLNLTQDSLSKRVNKSRSHIANLLRLLNLPPVVQKMVAENKLTQGHVRPLITMDDDREIINISQEIYDRKMSVREAERYIASLHKAPTETSQEPRNKDYDYVINLLESKLQTRVSVAGNKLSVHFSSDEDLNRILEVLELIE